MVWPDRTSVHQQLDASITSSQLLLLALNKLNQCGSYRADLPSSSLSSASFELIEVDELLHGSAEVGFTFGSDLLGRLDFGEDLGLR